MDKNHPSRFFDSLREIKHQMVSLFRSGNLTAEKRRDSNLQIFTKDVESDGLMAHYEAQGT